MIEEAIGNQHNFIGGIIMNAEKIWKILEDNAYIRTSGTEQEKQCAQYIADECRMLGVEPTLEPFSVAMSKMEKAELLMDGVSIPCKGYLLCGTWEVEAPFLYLPNTDACSMQQVKGKIVMVDGGMRYWVYQDLLKYGAAGFITYDGNVSFADRDIDQKELRPHVSNGNKLPGININAKDAVELIRKGVTTAKITIKQEEYEGTSHNLVADLPGETSEYIVLTAHYDSVSLSQGVYDNMSGSVGLLGLLDYFKDHPHRYGLRFLWCGSEERGLLGSKAYCAAHKEELEKIVLNINLDMIGCIMGKFESCCTSEEKLMHYIEYLAAEVGFGMYPVQDVYSSDSTPFADQGIPAVSFARLATSNVATIHNRYDTIELMSAEQMVKDIEFIRLFTEHMACAKRCPVERTMPEKMKEKLDIYLFRKKPENK